MNISIRFKIKHTIKYAALLTQILLLGSPFVTLANPHSEISVSAFDMPTISAYWSEATKVGMQKQNAMMKKAHAICVPWDYQTNQQVRACEQKIYPLIMAEAHKIYDVNIEAKTIAGIQTDVVTPKEGVSEENKRRVIINVHGGGFKFGSRFGGQLEAMPIADIGKFKVIAVDYSKAPEHIFPQAVKDVVTVYQALLKDYRPNQIAIYGCSAGSRITGEVIAWLHVNAIPLPAAVGLLCSAPTRLDGDSNHFAAAMKGQTPFQYQQFAYWNGVKPDDAVAFPGESYDMLAYFPPSILMTSTRDYSLSPMVAMHQKLKMLNKRSELHIFEGFGHAEFLSMYIPEAKHVARLMSEFFNRTFSR